MLSILKIGNWKIHAHANSIFQRNGKQWECSFVVRVAKSIHIVAKGKGSVTTYYFNCIFFGLLMQKFEQRLKLC